MVTCIKADKPGDPQFGFCTFFKDIQACLTDEYGFNKDLRKCKCGIPSNAHIDRDPIDAYKRFTVFQFWGFLLLIIIYEMASMYSLVSEPWPLSSEGVNVGSVFVGMVHLPRSTIPILVMSLVYLSFRFTWYSWLREPLCCCIPPCIPIPHYMMLTYAMGYMPCGCCSMFEGDGVAVFMACYSMLEALLLLLPVLSNATTALWALSLRYSDIDCQFKWISHMPGRKLEDSSTYSSTPCPPGVYDRMPEHPDCADGEAICTPSPACRPEYNEVSQEWACGLYPVDYTARHAADAALLFVLFALYAFSAYLYFKLYLKRDAVHAAKAFRDGRPWPPVQPATKEGGTATKLTNATTLTLAVTSADLGVQLSEHPQGERVDAVPPGSHGAAIGLQVGDVVTKVNDFPVRYYKGVKKCVILVENHGIVSEEAPVALAVLRGAPGQQAIGRDVVEMQV